MFENSFTILQLEELTREMRESGVRPEDALVKSDDGTYGIIRRASYIGYVDIDNLVVEMLSDG